MWQLKMTITITITSTITTTTTTTTTTTSTKATENEIIVEDLEITHGNMRCFHIKFVRLSSHHSLVAS